MAGLTKAQRAERELLAANANGSSAAPEQPELVAMIRDEPAFPGGPVAADVHADEIEDWTSHGWQLAEE
ncbi:hypothetical protein [Serratia sp. JSRIV004]|uniref:hypothetical protein n=1 Tax=Serratia sp. JSRIV004 TaxID=2831895 RepID=UPI001CBD1FE4|nr:hypothetical protein [Serratia sp. JSRIV004]UAN55349.1 hypothetical protein KGP21_16735 [Serratia sp. JSRIV004]